MRINPGAFLATALAALLILASPAAAATVAGDDCVANTVEANRTMIPFNSGPGAAFLNRVVGEPGGVITGWTVRVEPGQPTLSQRLETYAVLNEHEDARKEAESALETVGPGTSSFKTRIPVARSAHLGLYGPAGTFACHTGEAVVTGTFPGSAALGEVRTVTGLIGFRTPLTVNVEPDGDRDGYGDETQDECPYNAALQTECPPVTPKVDAVATKEKAILVGVGVSSQAQVQVFGQVSWKVRQKAGEGGGQARKGDRGLTVGLTAGAPRTVLPGAVADFRVRLPKPVLRRLGRLAPAQTLKARITIRTTDLAGRENDRVLTVKLRGRGR